MKNIVLSILLMSACAMIYAQADSSPYQAIVAVDGSGDYKTVQKQSMLYLTDRRNLVDSDKEWLV